MKKHITLVIVIELSLLSILSSLINAQNLPSPFTIVPQPQKIVLSGTKGLSPTTLKHLIIKGEFKRPVMGDCLSRLTIIDKPSGGSLILTLDKSITNLPDEGYILNISDDRAEIASTDEAGLFYGCQTLEQLLEDAIQFELPVPSLKITDYPGLSFRAVHIDLKHHLDHMNYYYESIDKLARYKINAAVFEFEDKLRYRRQPVVAGPQSISIDEMAALTLYARERHIEIIPLVQGLGHATFILKHEEYAGLRELTWSKWAFCPLNEGTYQVLFDMYRDAIDATPGSKYIHIGGDEIGNIGLCQRCKPTADKDGMLSLSLYWLKRVCEFAKANGRIPIFWDDMPLKHGGVYESTWSDEVKPDEAARAWKDGIPKLDSLLSDFPKNCIYMRWNYSMAHQPGNILALDWYQKHGLKAMIATATNTEGGMFFQDDNESNGSGIYPIRSFIKLASEKNISGMLCTAWDDKSPHMENYWHGFIAAAEYSWSPDGRKPADFDKAWLQKEFGLIVPDFKEIKDQLRRGTVFWYEALFKHGGQLDEDNALQSLPQIEHWLPPVEGREKIQNDYSTKLIDLPDRNFPGKWSKKNEEILNRALIIENAYKSLSEKLKDLGNKSLRNRYYWELSLSLFNLQSTTSSLLLALKKADSLDKNEQQTGLKDLKMSMQDFDLCWEQLKNTYSETRFISYPASFVPDRYFHLASQREDLSWMIQPEELFRRMIEKWLKEQ